MSNRMSHLIPLSVLSEELKMNTADTLTLIKIYNSNTIKDNRFNAELLNNEYFIKKLDADAAKEYFNNKLMDISSFASQTNISIGDIKFMLDKCSDDRISSLLPEGAKIKAFVLRGNYYIQKKYLKHFQERFSLFNESVAGAEEQASQIEEMEDEVPVLEDKQPLLPDEEFVEEPVSDEEFYYIDDEEDIDPDEEKKLKRKRADKKRWNAEQEKARKERENFNKLSDEKASAFNKAEQDKKSADSSSVSSAPDKKQEEIRAEQNRQLEEKKYEDSVYSSEQEKLRNEEKAKHQQKVQDVVGDKYDNVDENIIRKRKEEQEKYAAEQKAMLEKENTHRERSSTPAGSVSSSKEEKKPFANELKTGSLNGSYQAYKEAVKSPSILGTAREYVPKAQSPAISSGTSQQFIKSPAVQQMKNTALSVAYQDTYANNNIRTGTIDYGSYKISYRYHKKDEKEFQSFAESQKSKIKDNLLQSNLEAKDIPSVKTTDTRFRPTSISFRSGEEIQIDKTKLLTDSVRATGGSRATKSGKEDTNQTPVRAIDTANRAYVKIDKTQILDDAVRSVSQTAERYAAQNEITQGMVKTKKAAVAIKEVMELASYYSGVQSSTAIANVSNFIRSEGKSDREFRVNGRVSDPKAIFINSYRKNPSFKTDEVNEVLKRWNANKSLKEPYQLIDESFGLNIQKGKVSLGSKRMQSMMQREKIADISRIDSTRLDRLIKENPSLARELKRNQTANIYLSKGNIDLTKMSDVEIAKLLDKISDKDIKSIIRQRTGIKGFDGTFADSFDKVRNGKRVYLTQNTLRENQKKIIKALKLHTGIDYSKYSSKELLQLASQIKDKDIKTLLIGLAGHKHINESLMKNFRKPRLTQLKQTFRKNAQRNETMAGYYQIKDFVNNVRNIRTPYLVGKKIISVLEQQKRARVVSRLDNIEKKLSKPNLSDTKKKRLQKKELKYQKKEWRFQKKDKFRNKVNDAVDKVKDKTVGAFKRKVNGIWKKTPMGKLQFAIKNQRDRLLKKLAITKLGSAVGKLGAAIGKILGALKTALAAVAKYIIIGVVIVVAVVLLTNMLMYVVGTVGGMATSFFENLWSEDVMDSTAGSTLNNLIAYDEVFYKELDDIAERAKDTSVSQDSNFLSSVGLKNCYGFYDPDYPDGKSEGGFLGLGDRHIYRYHLNNAGAPYGVGGYEQHFYNGAGQEIARYSNAKDILSVSNAAFEGRVNVFDKVSQAYPRYCADLWDRTHICMINNCSSDIEIGYEIEMIPFPNEDAVFKLYIPVVKVDSANVHCHATDVYACATGDCDGDGTTNTYLYYCNTTPKKESDRTSEQKATQWVYDVKLWNGQKISSENWSKETAYLCVLNGDINKAGYKKTLYPSGNGCIKVMCVNNSGSFKEYTAYSDGFKEDINGNKIGYYLPSGKDANGKTVDCSDYTLSGHNKNNLSSCNNKFTVQHTSSEINNGTCSCTKTYCSYTYLSSSAYGHSEGYSNASFSKLTNCSNMGTGTIYNRCATETITEEKTGIWMNEKGKMQQYTLAITYETYTCSHKKHLGTETVSIPLTYSNGSSAGKFYVNIAQYDCSGEAQTVYYCKGECGSYQVCGGHTTCNGHYRCNGHTMNYCLGHVDVYSKIKIVGINDAEMFELAKFGEGAKRLHKSEVQDYAKSIYDGDWQDLYNISFNRSDTVAIPFSDSEITTLYGYDTHGHTPIAQLALTSIARIPYHYDYSINNTLPDRAENSEEMLKAFNMKTEPDSKGRVIAGLTSETFVQYMYYSSGHISISDCDTKNFYNFIGKNFTTTTKENLKAGDILYIPSSKTAVIFIREVNGMYLCVECSDGHSTVIYNLINPAVFSNFYTFNNSCSCK